MDTQWPRWEVFKKDTAKKPYQAVGSVHAADADHALLNARNVFVRRPQAVSLWVAPAAVIFSRTAEQLEQGNPLPDVDQSVQQTYQIFRKATHRRSMTFMDHIGQVEAPSPTHALQAAIAQFPDPPALAWWILSADQIISSGEDREMAAAWFDPAKTKTYKHQSAYGFVSARRQGRRRSGAKDE